MTDSTHLKLPFILPAQAGKNITHNEALAALDTLTQLAVLDRNLSAPPLSPAPGDRYIVGAAPSGAWAGKADQIAAWDGAAWLFHAAEPGWLAFVLDENGLLAWSGTAWLPTLGLDGKAPMLGLNATPDSTNRLAVASDAVLFSHASAGVQIKLNKHSSGDTASLLYQTGFSGRAELGTAGPSVKLDVDGPVRIRSYTVAGVPAATAAGQLIYVSNEAGGATIAFSDGTSWRRMADRAVIA